MSFSIPGFAVLARVAFDIPTEEGAGYFCALAVPALDEDSAEAAAIAHLTAPGCSVTVQDIRALNDAEAADLASVRALGDKVFFQADPSKTH